MKKLLTALCFLLVPIQGNAATINVPTDQAIRLGQNEFVVFDVEDFETFSLSFVNAALWSGGSILYTTDKTITDPWQATSVGQWAVNILHPQAAVWSWASDTVQEFGRFFAVNTYGKTYVHANATGGTEAPAPVPLPAAGFMLIAGLGALVAARRARRD